MPFDSNFLHSDVTDRILKCVYKVYNTLGAGFSEKLYENAMVLELREAGLEVQQQHPIKVNYKGHVIGEFVADLLVENKVIVELKALDALLPLHETQLINYLKVTGIKVGLLVNFGEDEPIFKRRVV